MRPFPGAPPVGILWMSKSAPGGFVRQRALTTESIVIHKVEGQIGRAADLHGVSRPKGCVHGWTQ